MPVSEDGLGELLLDTPGPSRGSGGALAEVEPRRLPVPDIICQEPPDEEDSFLCRILPGNGTATGDVRFGFGGRGERVPGPPLSLFGDE